LPTAAWASLYVEITTMRNLRHRNVLELVGAHVREPYRIITRFCPGRSVFDRLHGARAVRLTARELTMIAGEVAEGMRFLHEHGIVHRDLKTMNILLDSKNVAKIADFGLAGVAQAGQGLEGGVGTPHYTAPEVLERKVYGAKVDTYSFGIILWEMAARQIPFREKTTREIWDHVVVNNRRLPESPHIPGPLWNLIARCWHQDPSARPDFTEIVALFTTGEVYFRDGGVGAMTLKREAGGCPVLDMNYVVDVLSDPSHAKFVSVVEFIARNADKGVRRALRSRQVIAKYSAQSEHAGSVLVLASLVLADDEFPAFVETVARQVVDAILAEEDPTEIQAAVAFCLGVPDAHFDLVRGYVAEFMRGIGLPHVGPFVVRLVARLPDAEVKAFGKELIPYFEGAGVGAVCDQEALNAGARVFGLLVDDLDEAQAERFIAWVELPLDVPVAFIELLIAKLGRGNVRRLVHAVIRAAGRNDVTQCLVALLGMCEDSDLEALSADPAVFNGVQSLLSARRSVDCALLLVFRLSMVPSLPPILALNRPLLVSVLHVEGRRAQKLQIFTALFGNEEFCQDTTISNDVWKLLVSSFAVEGLPGYGLRMIAALSTHDVGRRFIMDMDMITLFTQTFLSSKGADASISLAILSNMAEFGIPQRSLIMACLVQDLLYPDKNRRETLETLIALVSKGPGLSLQEHDLQSSVLPLISPHRDPAIVVLAMRLVDQCVMARMKPRDGRIAQAVLNVLAMKGPIHPELAVAATSLIASLSNTQDMSGFITGTAFISFVESLVPQIQHLEELHIELKNCLYSLSRCMRQKEGDGADKRGE